MSGAALRLALMLALTCLASGCNRLSHIGQPPPMTPVGEGKSAKKLTAEEVISRLPTPAPPPALPSQPGSLWQTGSQSFFYDNRASRVGDILTVLIDIDEKASFDNQTKRSRDGTEEVGGTNFFGLESLLQKVLPNAVDPTSLINLNSDATSGGTGRSRRSEKVQMKMAAVITAVLPNGNLVINGNQEVRVNYDLRELQIAGLVRPQDITSENTVTYDKIAEARIAYGGRGQLFDLQQPRYGQQVLDVILPW